MAAHESHTELTLVELVTVLNANKWLILAITVVSGAIGYVYARSSQPVYAVDALMQIETKADKGVPSALGAMADLFQTANPAETEIEIIKSRLVLAKAAERLGMEIHAVPLGWGRKARILGEPRPKIAIDRFDVPKERFGEVFELEVYPSQTFVLRDENEQEVLRGRVGVGIDSSEQTSHMGIHVRSIDARAATLFAVVRRTSEAAVPELRQSLTVGEVGKGTGIIALRLQTFDGVEGERVLDEIATSYVRQNVDRKSAEAEKTLEFLNDQLPEIKRQLESSEERLNRFRSSMGTIDLSEEARLALKQQVDVHQSLFEAQQKRKELLQLFEAKHPSVVTLDNVIVNLSEQLNRQEGQVKELPLQQQEVVRLMRDVQVNTELYTSLLNNSYQLRVVKAGEIGNVRVIDEAVTTAQPLKPNKKNILLMALAIGFCFGTGISVLRRMLRNGIHDPGILERHFGLAVFAQVPHSRAQAGFRKSIRLNLPGMHVLAVKLPEDLSVESLRSLRTALEFAMADSKERIVVLTGPTEHVGKSFIAQNIAVVMAQAGRSVLLIDGDLRRGNLHASFGLHRGEGFSEILARRATLESTSVYPIEGLPLRFLSTGTLPPNPSELLHSLQTLECLREWSGQFELIIIDAPPVLAVTDAALLGQQATTTLLVLKSGLHPVDEIEATLARLRQTGVEVKGVILNNLPLQGARYAYQYGYSPRKTGQ